MSLASAILKIDSSVKNVTADRTIKAIIAVVASEAALYTTVIPHAPSLATSGSVAGGSGLLVALISVVITWANKSQTKQLAALGAAIDAAVAKRLDVPPQAGTPQTAA